MCNHTHSGNMLGANMLGKTRLNRDLSASWRLSLWCPSLWCLSLSCLSLTACMLFVTIGRAETTADSNAAPADGVNPSDVLSTAFQNRYDVDMVSTIELVMSNGRGQTRKREFEAVSKIIDGRLHSVGRIVWPNRLRGMTILTIEAGERGHDAFVYMPAMKIVRRISTAQRGDSFFGTDVTYEDLERRRIGDYVLESLENAEVAGEPVFVVTGAPHQRQTYSKVTFAISRADHAHPGDPFLQGAISPSPIESSPRSAIPWSSGPGTSYRSR